MYLMAYFFEPYSADDYDYEKEANSEIDLNFTTGSSGSNLDKSRLSSGSG